MCQPSESEGEHTGLCNNLGNTSIAKVAKQDPGLSTYKPLRISWTEFLTSSPFSWQISQILHSIHLQG